MVQFGLMTAIVLYWFFFMQVEGKDGTFWDAVSVFNQPPMWVGGKSTDVAAQIQNWSSDTLKDLGRLDQDDNRVVEPFPQPSLTLGPDRPQ